MQDYIATFHTHLSALQSCRALSSAGFQARMAPVPRSLSSSCGTCVFYTASDDCLSMMDPDVEGIFLVEGPERYRLLHEYE